MKTRLILFLIMLVAGIFISCTPEEKIEPITRTTKSLVLVIEDDFVRVNTHPKDTTCEPGRGD